jgi:hypothetical protein
MIPSQVPPHHQTAVVRQAIDISGYIAHTAPATTHRQMRQAGAPIEVNSEPCPLRTQAEVRLLVQRRPNLQCLIEAACPVQDLAPSGEIAPGSMVYLTFHKR